MPYGGRRAIVFYANRKRGIPHCQLVGRGVPDTPLRICMMKSIKKRHAAEVVPYGDRRAIVFYANRKRGIPHRQLVGRGVPDTPQ